MSPRRVFVVAGEASGDMYAGQVVRALLNQQPDLEVRGWGGDEMTAAGALVTKHYRDLAFMGFLEVIQNLGTIRRNLSRCWDEIEAFEPDLFLGVDFPGFNLRIAHRAKSRGIVVHHYISPSIWAWRKGRIRTIRRDVDRMYVTLPFESPLYEAVGMDVQFVGHPLLDVKAMPESGWRSQAGLSEDRPIVALLPGSRTQELKHMLPVLQEAAALMPESHQVVVAGAPGQPVKAYAGVPFPVVFGCTRELLASADFAWVTSGTATLEAALLNTPQLIVYKTSAVTYFIARSLARVRHIGLPNLIANDDVVPELIQGACTPEAIASRSVGLLPGGVERERQLKGYASLHRLLGNPGAAERVAAGILKP
jgi:lipid-A-disaccharide synthase